MQVVDTNILARFFIDDPNDIESQKQKAQAVDVMMQPIHIPVTVMLEFEWVMRGFYQLPKDDIARIFEVLLACRTIDIENRNEITQSVTLFQQGIDFADALHITRTQNIGEILTFDKKFFTKASQQALSIQLIRQ